MHLAGVPVFDKLVLDLARQLREAGIDATASKLEHAYDAHRNLVALTIPDREAILRALEHCPDGLAELRATLLRWRLREGL